MSGRDDPFHAQPYLRPPLTMAVETASSWAAAQMHLFANTLGMARNLHDAASILLPQAETPSSAPTPQPVAKEEPPVIDIERDARVGIDLKFGTLTFEAVGDGEQAVALFDVIVTGDGNAASTRVQMEVKVPAHAETDSIIAVTEACRSQIVARLRAAADTLDATTARDLVFHKTA